MNITSRKTKATIKSIGEFEPGDADPTTAKKIVYIVYQTNSFIVSIDASLSLNWYAVNDLKTAPDFGKIASQVTLADSLVDRIFVGKKNRLAYKKLLGDVLATLLEEGDTATAGATLTEVSSRIKKHSEERVRTAYIFYALNTVIALGICIIFTLLYKDCLKQSIGNPKLFHILICTYLGGIGAFLTTFATFKNYDGNFIAGLPIHRLDGFLRIFYGLIAGLVISLAINGNVLAGFADNENSPWLLYFFAMVAGASEILIPNLIKQGERQVNLRDRDTNAGATPNDAAPASPPASPPEEDDFI